LVMGKVQILEVELVFSNDAAGRLVEGEYER
jgi:hypothetical protein